MAVQRLHPWHNLRLRKPSFWRQSCAAELPGSLESVATDWSDAEAALLQHQLGRPCYLAADDDRALASLKSAVLGYDLPSGRLVLDACWPNLALLDTLINKRLSTRLSHGQYRLRLNLECEDVLDLPGGAALRARVVQHYLESTLTEAVTFKALHAPQTELLVPGQGVWIASLCRLATDSLTLRGSSSQPMSSWKGHQGSCTLILGRGYRMSFPVLVGAVLRQPQRQCQMALTLGETSAELRQQLASFVRLLVPEAAHG